MLGVFPQSVTPPYLEKENPSSPNKSQTLRLLVLLLLITAELQKKQQQQQQKTTWSTDNGVGVINKCWWALQW